MKYGDRRFTLEKYMTGGVNNVVRDIMKSTFFNAKEREFMTSYARASRQAAKLRSQAEKEGEHIPPFLIASITSSCNLHCAGCYARENDICNDEVPQNQLSGAEWRDLFEQARDLGVGFILLAGGEPMIRRDVIEAAGEIPEILFPVFTNGTMLSDDYIDLFDRKRNLVPIVSIEGHETLTDDRRGAGVYRAVTTGMQKIQEKGLIFGDSVTVTTENLEEVTSDDFIRDLEERGCKAVIFVEFVPVTEDSKHLAPGDAERALLRARIKHLKRTFNMVFISFPGDEKTSGGCLAAGRGFFHINPHGGAEPCPFSPYSDVNVRDTSLREAMHSKLFQALQDGDILMEDHDGGCILFEKKDQVEALLQGGDARGENGDGRSTERITQTKRKEHPCFRSLLWKMTKI